MNVGISGKMQSSAHQRILTNGACLTTVHVKNIIGSSEDCALENNRQSKIENHLHFLLLS